MSVHDVLDVARWVGVWVAVSPVAGLLAGAAMKAGKGRRDRVSKDELMEIELYVNATGGV